MSVPKYLHILYDLQNKINKELIKPGNMLPSENELTKTYSASRMTVRRSLSLLKDYGYVYAIPGKGYFIRKPEQNKYVLYFNEMDVIGVSKENTRLLKVSIIPSTAKIKKKLQIIEDTRLVMIRRLLYSSEKPVAYDIKYLLYDRGKPIVEKEIHYATFPELIAKYTSLFSVKKDLKINCQPAKAWLTHLLKIEPGYPIVVVEQKLRNDHNKPLGLGTTFINGDYFTLAASSANEQILNSIIPYQDYL